MTNRMILLVEDNPDDVALTVRALRKSKIAHELVVFNNGLDAIEHLMSAATAPATERLALPRVMLLDLKLPSLTGLETLQRLRAAPHLRALPIIVFTSSREEQDIIASYNFGANSYIRKPVDFDEFLAMIQNIGIYWLDYNEAPPRGGLA